MLKNSAAKCRALSHLLLLVALLFTKSALAAQEKFLSESELTELSVQAFSGQKTAVKKIIEEFKRYELLQKNKMPLSLSEKEQLNEIIETLQILAPQSLPPETVSQHKKIVVEKPLQKNPPSAKIKNTEEFSEQLKKYFNFDEGTVLIYSGKRKGILDAEWSESGRSLKSHLLKIKNKKNRAIEILTLNEIFSRQGEWLAEQFFVTYQCFLTGIRIQKEIVLNQPSPGTLASIGKQEPYWIAKFPLKIGDQINGYKVESLSSTVRTPLGEFSDCLIISGQVEKLVFAPRAGPVVIELFDEQWLAKERTDPLQIPLANTSGQKGENLKTVALSHAALKRLERTIKQFCRKNHFQFQLLLSAGPDGSSKEDILSRTLVYKRNKQDPDQKIFEVLQQSWAKKVGGKKMVWKLNP